MAKLTHRSARRLAPIALAALAAFHLACAGEPATRSADSGPPDDSLGLPAGADAAAEAITAQTLREAVAELSDDRYEGRLPGTPGDAAARAYLIEQLGALGLAPGAADGGWEQTFEIVGITSTAPASWRFTAGGESLELAFWDDTIATSGVQRDTSRVTDAEVVFVGYGIEAPEHGWDDYKGADLTGKVLLMLNNDPDWDATLFAGPRRLYYGRWTYKYEVAARRGAAAAIIIHTTPSAGYPWQVVQTSWTGQQQELPAGEEPRVEVAGWTSWEASRRLAALAGHDLDELVAAARSPEFRPVPLGVRTSLELANEVSRGVETANVLALLPGGDKADETVIYTAHHDHLGRGQPNADGDDIYNGALDNAAGVAQVLAIAAAFQALPEPPRRSILFALVSAEEQGLLGSAHYATHPTIHPGRLAANLNFDSGNIWGRSRDVSYIGYGKSSLDRVVEAAAARQDRRVLADQYPDRGYFYRSDQFNLAKIGIPAIYLSAGTDFRGRDPEWGRQQIDTWTQTHYHQPSDELGDSWSFEGLVEDARLGFLCGLAIAQADALPAWNPGDEFEAARLEALAAADSP